MKRHSFLMIMGISVIFLLDQVLKLYAKQGKELILIATRYIHVAFRLFRNNNLAFSIPFNEKLLIPTITLIIVILALYILKQTQTSKIPLIVVLVGAIGNLVDRIWNGYVIDYIEITVSKITLPIFNIADILIFVGIIVFLLSSSKKNTTQL